MVIGSRLYIALGGDFGPRLALGPGARVRWANRLDTAPPEAIVLVDSGSRLRAWGGAVQARFYLALTSVGLGEFPRAAHALWQAARQSGREIPFFYSPDELLTTPAAIQQNAAAFDAFLSGPDIATAGLTPGQGEVLRPMFRDLLKIATSKE